VVRIAISEQFQHVFRRATDDCAIALNDNRTLDELGVVVQQLDPQSTKTLNTSEQENFESKLTEGMGTLNFGFASFQM
jgi:hypothetical protein